MELEIETVMIDIKDLRAKMDQFNRLKHEIDSLKESLMEQLKDSGQIELPKDLAPFKTLEVTTSQRSGFTVEATTFEILKWGKKKKKK